LRVKVKLWRKQGNRRGGQDREEGQRKARGASGRVETSHYQEGSDKGVLRDGSSNGTKAKHEGSQHHRDGGLKALRLEPQSAVSPDVSLPFRGSSETTGECTCFTGAQDTTQHVLEECEEEGSLGETEKTARGHKGCLPLPSDRPDQRRESKKEINSRKKQR
jgi:hypothetical protein